MRSGAPRIHHHRHVRCRSWCRPANIRLTNRQQRRRKSPEPAETAHFGPKGWSVTKTRRGTLADTDPQNRKRENPADAREWICKSLVLTARLPALRRSPDAANCRLNGHKCPSTGKWVDSSVGRAAPLQGAGRRFEPCSAYKSKATFLSRVPRDSTSYGEGGFFIFRFALWPSGSDLYRRVDLHVAQRESCHVAVGVGLGKRANEDHLFCHRIVRVGAA